MDQSGILSRIWQRHQIKEQQVKWKWVDLSTFIVIIWSGSSPALINEINFSHHIIRGAAFHAFYGWDKRGKMVQNIGPLKILVFF